MAIRAVDAMPMFTWIGILLLAPSIVLTVLDGINGWAQPLHMWSDATHLLFYAYTTVSLIAYMFRDDKVTTDELFAVGATFTVAVWTFAYAYSIINHVYPGSFVATSISSAPERVAQSRAAKSRPRPRGRRTQSDPIASRYRSSTTARSARWRSIRQPRSRKEMPSAFHRSRAASRRRSGRWPSRLVTRHQATSAPY